MDVSHDRVLCLSITLAYLSILRSYDADKSIILNDFELVLHIVICIVLYCCCMSLCCRCCCCWWLLLLLLLWLSSPSTSAWLLLELPSLTLAVSRFLMRYCSCCNTIQRDIWCKHSIQPNDCNRMSQMHFQPFIPVRCEYVGPLFFTISTAIHTRGQEFSLSSVAVVVALPGHRVNVQVGTQQQNQCRKSKYKHTISKKLKWGTTNCKSMHSSFI